LPPLLKKIPSDRLLLETDAPYLVPRTLPKTERNRSGRNEPKNLVHIARFIADILHKPMETLAQETTTNAARFFKFFNYFDD
jgi:TatD DNase family protein